MLDNWSKQPTLEVSVMATELVSVRFSFLQRNRVYETKISIHVTDIYSNPYSTYFLNSIQVSFHVLV